MYRVEAMIRNEQFEDVTTTLSASDIEFVTRPICRSNGWPRFGMFRGSAYLLPPNAELQIEVLCDDDEVHSIVTCIMEALNGEQPNGARIVVVPIAQVIEPEVAKESSRLASRSSRKVFQPWFATT